MQYSDRYLGFMGQGPKRVPQWETMSCPEAMSEITGVDYYQNPRSCVQKMNELYPRLELPLPGSEGPIARPEDMTTDAQGHRHVRWGDDQTRHFDWGKDFHSIEDVLAYSPLAHLNLEGTDVPEAYNYEDEDQLYRELRSRCPADWDDTTPEGGTRRRRYYNTLFIWPIVTFGYERFLEACLEPEFERIMNEFAELSGRAFRAMAKLPIHFVDCHDDIVATQGPMVPPWWIQKHIFPHYRRWWSMIRETGKEVIFTTDGCVDVFADELMDMGIRGIRTEPYTDFKAIAKKHPQAFLAGEGDVRVLMKNNPIEIRAMVESMVETARMCGGYFFQIGNLIPHNVPAEALKLYLDLCEELGYR
jgi:hypothetical protein